jgi:hypothetical protein
MKRALFVCALFFLGCRRATPTPSATGSATVTATASGPATGTAAPPPSGSTSAPSSQPPEAKGPKLLPVDEAQQDPSFVAFRDSLLAAVRRHDTKALLAALDPKIRTSFGAGGGIEGFRRQWKPEAADSKIWNVLEDVLSHGGTFGKDGAATTFWAPYWYSAYPEDQDAFETYAVIGSNVAMRERPDAGAPVVATLDHDIVRVVPSKEHAGWRQFTTFDGRKGWLAERDVRSPIGYRAGFSKDKSGRWTMNALVSGD